MYIGPPRHLENLLSRLLSRSPLDSDARKAVLSISGHPIDVKAGRSLARRGDNVNSACLVLAGMLGSSQMLRDGRRQISAVHIEGDIADLSLLMLPKAVRDLEALTNSVVVYLPHIELNRLSGQHPNVAAALWRDSSVDAGIAAQWVINVGRRNARSRVAHLLCEMTYRYRRLGRNVEGSYCLSMTQGQLSDALGMTPVHINRTLQSFRRERIVELHSKIVRIHDWDALVAAADFDPDYLSFDCDVKSEQPMLSLVSA